MDSRHLAGDRKGFMALMLTAMLVGVVLASMPCRPRPARYASARMSGSVATIFRTRLSTENTVLKSISTT